ncbi:unnamed protein product, partial [Iphiclides podalirius]
MSERKRTEPQFRGSGARRRRKLQGRRKLPRLGQFHAGPNIGQTFQLDCVGVELGLLFGVSSLEDRSARIASAKILSSPCIQDMAARTESAREKPASASEQTRVHNEPASDAAQMEYDAIVDPQKKGNHST